MEISKVMSKFYRLKMTDSIRNLVVALPAKDLQETQVGDHVYLAHGKIQFGYVYYPSKIHIWLWNRNISVSVKSEEIGFHVVFPFNNEYEQTRAPLIINTAIRNHLN